MKYLKCNYLYNYNLIVGQAGGFCGICLVYPLDTAKTRLQTYSTYNSTTDVLGSMIKADGVKSLYRGLPAPAIGFGLTFAISFRYSHFDF